MLALQNAAPAYRAEDPDNRLPSVTVAWEALHKYMEPPDTCAVEFTTELRPTIVMLPPEIHTAPPEICAEELTTALWLSITFA